MVAPLNRRAIVPTNERILPIQTDGRGRPKDLHTQIRYPSIERITRTLFGGTQIEFRTGRDALATLWIARKGHYPARDR